MSAIIKQIKQTLPIQLEPEVNKDIRGINLYICSFTWNQRPFVNVESGEKTKIKMWCFGGLVLLNSTLKSGRHILVHEKVPKYITNQKGEVLETKILNKTRIIGKEYGFEALSSTLSAIYPCSVEKAKELVREAKNKQIKHAKLVLKSDLEIPTSPQLYEKMGLKNEWVVISDYPSLDEMEEKINEILKRQGSPLRARFGLKWRLQS